MNITYSKHVSDACSIADVLAVRDIHIKTCKNPFILEMGGEVTTGALFSWLVSHVPSAASGSIQPWEGAPSKASGLNRWLQQCGDDGCVLTTWGKLP